MAAPENARSDPGGAPGPALRDDGPWILLYALLSAGLLGPALLGVDPVYGFDTVHEKIFWREWVVGRLAAGELPVWCPGLLAGIPLAAEPVVGALYPPVLLFHALLPPGAAINATWLTSFWLAATGMHLLARQRGLSPAAACGGALSYAFGAWMVGHVPLGGLPHAAAAAWTPWVFATAFRIVDRGPDRRATAALAVTTGLCLAGGHLQFAYATLVGLGLVLALAGGTNALRAIPALGLGITLGFLLVAATLVPYAEWLAVSNRGEAPSIDFALSGGRLVVPQLLAGVAPTFFGDSVSTPYWGFPTQGMVTPYPGLVALFLAAVAVAPGRTRERRAVLALAALGLLLAVGAATPVHAWIHAVLPGFDRLRHPGRWLHLTALGIAWLAALGLDARLRGSDPRPLSRVLALPAATAALLALGAAITAARPEPWRSLFEAMAATGGFLPGDPLAARDPGALAEARRASALALLRSLAVAGLSLAALAHLARRTADGSRVATAGPLLAVLALDLLQYGTRYAIPVPHQQVAGPADLRALVGDPGPAWRVGHRLPGRTYPYPGHFARSHGWLDPVRQDWMHRALTWELASAQAVVPVLPRSYAELTLPHREANLGQVPLGPRPVLDLLAVRLLLTEAGSDPPGEAFTRIGETAGVAVWQNERALPRAFLAGTCRSVPDRDAAIRHLRSEAFSPRDEAVVVGPCPPGLETGPPGRASLTRSDPTAVEVEVAAARRSLLVLSDQHYPGWRATLDGAPVDLVRVDLALRGVVVPAGRHTVRFLFVPARAGLGAGVALLGLAAVGWLSRPRSGMGGS